MTRVPLSEAMVAGNECFGCGVDNPEGLRIRIFRDGDRNDRLVGEYVPRITHGGFPKIVHGGLQFTALDCMAGWIVFSLRAADRLIPLTRSAQVRYRRPVPIEQPLALSAEIASIESAKKAGKALEQYHIRTTLESASGDVLTEVDFDYTVVHESIFRKMVGVDELPEFLQRHFASAGSAASDRG